MTATNLPFVYPQYPSVLDSSFTTIDWRAPWLYHLNQLSYLSELIKLLSGRNVRDEQQVNAASFDHSNDQIAIIAKVLNTALSQQSDDSKTALPTTKPTADNQAYTLEFAAQNALPEGEGYEHFIATTGQIPTRNNLHDLFNGSIWLTFPKTKALLNYYHMLEIAKRIDEQDSGASRGRVRDTITVFDENGAVLVTAEPSIGEALMNFDWQGSLVQPRSSWDNPFECSLDNRAEAKAAVYIFGHALLEQLIQPRKPLCAHSVVITVSQYFFTLPTAERMNYLDHRLARYMDELLSQHQVTPRQLAPLPILGVPHFWSENADVRFYDDNYVFRSGRQSSKQLRK